MVYLDKLQIFVVLFPAKMLIGPDLNLTRAAVALLVYVVVLEMVCSMNRPNCTAASVSS